MPFEQKSGNLIGETYMLCTIGNKKESKEKTSVTTNFCRANQE